MLNGPGGEELRRTIRAVRRRWRLGVALRGAAVCVAVFLMVLLVSAFGLDQLRYSPWAIAAFRIFAYASLIGLLLRYLVLPLLSRVSDERVALYIEENEPSLDAALVSAVEAAPAALEPRPEVSPELARRLIETAVERCQRLDYGRFVEQRRLQRLSAAVAGVAVAGMLLALLSPAFLRQAAPYLLAPWRVRAATPYAIDVEPGNATLARGADQPVLARLKGFDSDRVFVASKSGAGDWTRADMSADAEAKGFRAVLLDVRDATEYFVESSGVRSPVFRLAVADMPYVKRIDLEYHFPAYTGREPQKFEDGGDIAALKGTEVRLSITPTIRVGSGRLLVEGAAPVALTAGDDGTLRGSLVVSKEGFYKIELPAADGALKAASADYAIEVLQDQPPSVAFLKPGRDTKVTPIEEVFAEAKAEDDFGIARLELVYSVNGGTEKSVPLQKGRPRKFVSAGHTFFLEELELSPGDFVSYYARAADAATPAQSATTDIYFLEARPFRRDYRQAEQGGMGGGGGGDRAGGLSQQQRQIIAATFKLVRDKARTPEKQQAEDVRTLALIQGRLREQVETLVSRMQSRGVLDAGSELQQTAEELRAAATQMKDAEGGLARRQPQQALPPEQRALAHLQRAEAAFRDVQVAFGDGGGGGEGQNANAEDLADLFELELDKLRNQYETVQRGQQEQRDNQVDEALARLQELARRQEQENERRRQLAGRLPNQGGGGGGQRELAQEAEELGRRLEKLTRENPSPQLEETVRRLKEAADAMRRSAANNQGGTPGEGSAALERLKEARRLLEQSRNARLDRDLREAQRKAEELANAQRKIASDVKDLRAQAQAGEASPQAGGSGERMQRLLERKDSLASGVADLEAQLDRMARDSRREQKQASRKLQESADAIRDNKLKEKIRYSKGVVRGGSPEQAERFESEIGGDLESLGKKLREAESAIGQSGEQRLAQALDRARDLARNMESMSERLRDRGGSQGQQQQSGEGERGRQPGQRGQQGEEGQRQGERGQAQGQPGREGERGQGQQGQEGRGQQGQQGQDGGGQQGRQGREGGSQQGQGERGQSRAGEASGGGPDPAGSSNFGIRGGGRPGRLSADDVRQLRRELRERLGEAQELGRDLNRAGRQGSELDPIVRKMRALDADKNWGDPLGMAELTAAVVEDLKLLEYALRREAEGGERRKLYLNGSEELPPGWRALVEEYYKALARSQK
jgi:hypothetical protein